jgi:hypothetical protein
MIPISLFPGILMARKAVRGDDDRKAVRKDEPDEGKE